QFDYFTFIYLIAGLIVPIFVLLVKLLFAEEKKHFHTVSTLSKFVMLIGLIYSIFFRFMVA
ncbi:MAG TPA: hypothetical protein PLF99_08625, partial [Tenuifilaceae bacterium]|nr:hypothetical protein [Tenuifilaceae bacterium]